jgi:hypothetical protein
MERKSGAGRPATGEEFRNVSPYKDGAKCHFDANCFHRIQEGQTFSGNLNDRRFVSGYAFRHTAKQHDESRLQALQRLASCRLRQFPAAKAGAIATDGIAEAIP